MVSGYYQYKCFTTDGGEFTGDGNLHATFSADSTITVKSACYVGVNIGTITVRIYNVPGYGTVVSDGMPT